MMADKRMKFEWFQIAVENHAMRWLWLGNCRRLVAVTRSLLTFCVICDLFTPNVRLVCRPNYSVTSLPQV